MPVRQGAGDSTSVLSSFAGSTTKLDDIPPSTEPLRRPPNRKKTAKASQPANQPANTAQTSQPVNQPKKPLIKQRVNILIPAKVNEKRDKN